MREIFKRGEFYMAHSEMSNDANERRVELHKSIHFDTATFRTPRG
jgi:hypothetical protein